MKIQSKPNCPLNKFQKCKELDCGWFIKIVGNNPNTGEQVDEWACAISWLPLLMIENSQQQRHTGAAVESFRNEMVKAQSQFSRMLITGTVEPEKQIKYLENAEEIYDLDKDKQDDESDDNNESDDKK